MDIREVGVGMTTTIPQEDQKIGTSMSEPFVMEMDTQICFVSRGNIKMETTKIMEINELYYSQKKVVMLENVKTKWKEMRMCGSLIVVHLIKLIINES